MGWYDYVFRVYFYAAVTCLVLNLFIGLEFSSVSWAGVAAGFGLALGPQIIGHGSMNYAVKYVSPTLLSTLILAEPLIASVLAYFLFDEIPPISSMLAMGAILAGIMLTWKRKNTDDS
jgi:drug/metabolite transporter (DMT)-like permease